MGEFLYPAILDPPTPLFFDDQFAFRPMGSTTSALIALMQTITDLLATNSFICLIALDFTKAFDTVCRDTLLNKMALLNIPDAIITGWLVSFKITNTVPNMEYQHLIDVYLDFLTRGGWSRC